MIDLRSDTVTKPSPAMRKAMAEAEVGDDVYREDPTVNRLEARAAEVFDKQAALFVPSGCMGNTIGIKVNTHHGQEIICDWRAHILNYELAMAGWFAGCLCRAIPTERGILSWEQVRKEIRHVSPHWAPTGLVEIENSHNVGGGAVYPPVVIDEICDGAHSMGVRVHIDGARIFNAATAAGRPVKELAAKADTVSFCLSKGLGAPVGSMLVGRKDDIDHGRLLRKRLGGGMRQAGILAAAGLMALEEGPKRLHEDHANAKFLAERLAELPGIQLDPASVQTNIVIFEVSGTGRTPAELSALFKERGVLINGMGATHMRIVTHLDVDRAACEKALDAVRDVLQPVAVA